MQRFGGGQFQSNNELFWKVNNTKTSKGIVFRSFIVGSKNKAARVLQRDGGIAGGRSLNAMYLFTRRMMHRYGLAFKVQKQDVFKAIIVHNKRFTAQNVEMFQELALYYSPNMTIDYINWETVKPFSTATENASANGFIHHGTWYGYVVASIYGGGEFRTQSWGM